MRVRLRRTLTGEWLHQDVPITLSYTEGLSGKNRATGIVPAAFDVPAADDLPMWLERGTTVYVEDDTGELVWAGLCSYSSPSKTARSVEFGGVLSLYDLMAYQSVLSAWQPNPADVVDLLLADGHAQLHGTLEVSVVRDGAIPGFLGDEFPPVPRPARPARAPGESLEDYHDDLFAWQEAGDDWDALYASREPYQLAWWDHKYIGDEVRALAAAVPFDVTERSYWETYATDPRHELHVGPEAGVLHNDIALVQGQNLVGDIAPSTNAGIFGNDVWVLGAGEGQATKLGRSAGSDNRVRTTRFFEEPGLTVQAQLDTRADYLRGLAVLSVTLGSAQARQDSLPGLRAGDWLPIETDLYTGVARVIEITRSTAGGPIGLTFDTGGDA